MRTKLINNYNNPCKKISWSKLNIGDYFFLEHTGLCLKISEKDYFCGECNLLAPIRDKENLGEVKVEVHWEKMFEE